MDGIRGAVHIGVLKALEENDINVNIIGGTSSGSLVAALYAMGYSPCHILEIFKRYGKLITAIEKRPILDGLESYITTKKFKFTGINKGNKIENLYNEFASKKNIFKMYDIKMPIVIPTIDLTDGKEYVFTNSIPKNSTENKYISDISIGTAVRASSSFPGIFYPCKFKEHIFLDGGTLNNSPINEVKSQGADKIITVNFEPIKIDSNSSAFDIVLKAIDIMGNKIIEENMKKSDIILTIPIKDKVGFLDVNKIEDLYNYGFNETMKKIEDIKKLAK